MRPFIESRTYRTGPFGRCVTRGGLPAAAAIVGFAACGCSDNTGREIHHFLKAHEHQVAGAEYRVAPPDALLISCAQAPEVDGEVQIVRSDGKVGLRLLGEVKVAGQTTQEISTKLEGLLGRFYTHPEVSVRVAAYRSKYVYVFGQVGAPGAYPFTGRDSLLNILSRAQPTFLAWKAQTKVIRPSPDKQDVHEIVVNVDEMVEHGDTSKNFLLQEGDIVYMPPTPLAWVGLRVRELLYPVTPIAQAVVAPAAVKASYDVYDNWNDDTAGAVPVGAGGVGLP